MAQRQLDRMSVIESLVRLRHVARACGEASRDQLEPVISLLEDAAGPTVSRAEAARLLHISYPSLDRWISKGDIAALVTPSGRREIPLPQLVDLLAELDGRQKGDRLALASVMRERRRRAAEIPTDAILPRPRRDRTHRTAELQALAYHRLVAQRLDEELVARARRRLSRWAENGRIHPRWRQEWERILAMPIPKIARLISSDGKRARELRQTSPFAGALTEQERRRVLETVKNRASP